MAPSVCREVAGVQLAPGGRVQTPLRNMESTAATTRELNAGRQDHFWGVNVVFRCRGWGKIRLCHHSLTAARGGNARMMPNVQSSGTRDQPA